MVTVEIAPNVVTTLSDSTARRLLELTMSFLDDGRYASGEELEETVIELFEEFEAKGLFPK